MAARLGNVLYWLGCTIALTCSALAVAAGIAIYLNNPTDPWGGLFVVAALAAIALPSWLVGLASRYVLAGPKRQTNSVALSSTETKWYFVDGEDTKGPVSIRELRSFLYRHSAPDDVLIWHENLQDWKRAGDSPEVRARRGGIPATERKERWYSNSKFITSAVIVVFIVGSQQLRRMNEQSHADNEFVTGITRANFIEGGLKTCREKQRKSPENAGFSDLKIGTYCTCFMNGLANNIKWGQLRTVSETNIPAPIRAQADKISEQCAASL